ncbi:MAG: biotin/lipoyl-binding protein [Planctomycetales bacterium]|nr:biotin/lipoyl-binding protein [Planctomycetales bacterium]
MPTAAHRYVLEGPEGPGGSFELWVEPLGDGRLRIRPGAALAGAPVSSVEVRPGPGGGALVPVEVGGRRRLVGFARLADGRYQIVWEGVPRVVAIADPGASASLATGPAGAAGGGSVAAPIPGMVVKVHVAPGARVTAGAPLVVLYAMKVENDIRAPCGGSVAEVRAREGQPVEKGDLLVRIEGGP